MRWCDTLSGCVRPFRPHPSLARHLPPRRGRLLRWNDFSMFYLLTCLQIDAVSIFHGTTVVAFPFEGEGGAPATDEGGRAVLTFAPNRLRITPRRPTCHLRANDFVIAAQPAKNHARPPTIAAQRTPPQAGRRQAGSPLLRGTTQSNVPPKKASKVHTTDKWLRTLVLSHLSVV